MTNISTESEVLLKGNLAKKASTILNMKTTEEKNDALSKIANQLLIDQAEILSENEKDIASGKEKGLSDSILDRILLTESRINAMAEAVKQLIELKDPVGEILETIQKENGLKIEKKRVPLGVIGMIYEARPNVTIDAATLCLKTGNAVILRGSSSAKHSNKALVKSIHRALENTTLPLTSVQLIEDTRHETAKELFNLNEYLDVLIPRGSKALIDLVVKESTVPVLETGAGNCHIYVDYNAQYNMAETILLNAKTQRPSVCNAAENLLIQKEWFVDNGEKLLLTLHEHGVSVIGDEKVCEVLPSATRATEEDYATEHLSLTISVKVVDNVDKAIEHVNKYSTKHSEAIITEDVINAANFLNNVDVCSCLS
ncbi:Gamma-glutamyl phosphate reductase OS=Ureibacillus acetophenoni OX=614649 GN=proA PE=3 SV=1 [Ureibacillus acetophenoni]